MLIFNISRGYTIKGAVKCDQKSCKNECNNTPTTATTSTTTTTTTTTLPPTTTTHLASTTESNGADCSRCQYSNGQAWLPDLKNCHG